jgi:hypothetical protein
VYLFFGRLILKGKKSAAGVLDGDLDGSFRVSSFSRRSLPYNASPNGQPWPLVSDPDF